MKHKFMIISLVLALIIVSAAFAQESETGTAEVTVEFPTIEQELPEKRSEDKALSISSNDIVSISGNKYKINTGSVEINLDLDPNLGFLCLTQDFAASIDSYFLYADPIYVWRGIIKDGIHLWLDNDNALITIITDEDKFSNQVKDLSGNPETLQKAHMERFIDGFSGIYSSELVTFDNGMTWMSINDVTYITIVNGQYVWLTWGSWLNKEMTADDLKDLRDLLSGMTIAGV